MSLNQKEPNDLGGSPGDWDPILGQARAFLVGAGPGHPGLLTLRGRDILTRAQVVLYDRLVNRRLLEYCPAPCEKICVAGLDGTHPERWPEICKLLVEKALSHQVVVRLKGGDPFLFGRGAEECEALIAAGIPFEVVPGVSSGLGAPAWAGVPVTHRQFSSAVAFVTAHEPAEKESLIQWDALAKFPGTLVFFMPLRQIAQLRDRLVAQGKPAETQVALIEKGTRCDQRVKITTLAEMPAAAEGLISPTLVVIGEVVAFRKSLNWTEKRPLSGLPILLTRPANQATATLNAYEAWGATVENEPIVELCLVDDWEPIDRTLDTLARFSWIVFTSAMGVTIFFDRMEQRGYDARKLAQSRLACIGPSTASALAEYRIKPDLVASSYSSETLALELGNQLAGGEVLLFRADRGRDLLAIELAKKAAVTQITAYRQRDLDRLSPRRVKEFQDRKWRWVVLGSANIARGFARLLKNEAIAPSQFPLIAAISPITAQALSESGIQADAIAETYTMMGAAQAIARWENEKRRPTV